MDRRGNVHELTDVETHGSAENVHDLEAGTGLFGFLNRLFGPLGSYVILFEPQTTIFSCV